MKITKYSTAIIIIIIILLSGCERDPSFKFEKIYPNTDDVIRSNEGFARLLVIGYEDSISVFDTQQKKLFHSIYKHINGVKLPGKLKSIHRPYSYGCILEYDDMLESIHPSSFVSMSQVNLPNLKDLHFQYYNDFSAIFNQENRVLLFRNVFDLNNYEEINLSFIPGRLQEDYEDYLISGCSQNHQDSLIYRVSNSGLNVTQTIFLGYNPIDFYSYDEHRYLALCQGKYIYNEQEDSYKSITSPQIVYYDAKNKEYIDSVSIATVDENYIPTYLSTYYVKNDGIYKFEMNDYYSYEGSDSSILICEKIIEGDFSYENFGIHPQDNIVQRYNYQLHLLKKDVLTGNCNILIYNEYSKSIVDSIDIGKNVIGLY